MKTVKFILFLAVCVLVLSSCGGATTSEKNTTALISLGANNNSYLVEVEDYVRISSGWIVINAKDGRSFSTNEENVLIIRQP